MTSSKVPNHAAPVVGRALWVAAMLAALCLLGGIAFAYVEEGLTHPFRFSLAHFSLDTAGRKAELCFSLGIGILFGLPVFRDLLVLMVSLRRKEKKQAILAALGAAALLIVYATLWLGNLTGET